MPRSSRGSSVDRWDEYRAGKLKLPAIVQSDVSGVLVATEDGYVGPYKPRKDWTAAQYVALALDTPEPEPEEDYRTKYVELKARVDAIDTTATKAQIVAALTGLRAAKTLEEVRA